MLIYEIFNFPKHNQQKCLLEKYAKNESSNFQETASAETQADSTPRNGSQRFRSRTDKNDKNGPPDTYTVS